MIPVLEKPFEFAKSAWTIDVRDVDLLFLEQMPGLDLRYRTSCADGRIQRSRRTDHREATIILDLQMFGDRLYRTT